VDFVFHDRPADTQRAGFETLSFRWKESRFTIHAF
jgi:hypothetical protein